MYSRHAALRDTAENAVREKVPVRGRIEVYPLKSKCTETLCAFGIRGVMLLNKSLCGGHEPAKCWTEDFSAAAQSLAGLSSI